MNNPLIPALVEFTVQWGTANSAHLIIRLNSILENDKGYGNKGKVEKGRNERWGGCRRESM